MVIIIIFPADKKSIVPSHISEQFAPTPLSAYFMDSLLQAPSNGWQSYRTFKNTSTYRQSTQIYTLK